MRLWQWLTRLFRPKIYGAAPICPHGPVTVPYEITLDGEPWDWTDPKYCADCAEKWMKHFATTCAACRKPIYPYDHVALSGESNPRYRHTSWECCETLAAYCGMWGEGRLVTLHELQPEKYPEGATSVIEAVHQKGETISDTIP